MKVLDLTDLESSDIQYRISKFPDGQQQIDLEINSSIIKVVNVDTDGIKILSRLNSFLDLELILSATADLREAGINKIHLYTPYFLGGRSDRKFTEGGSNYLKTVICPIINSQKYESVTVLDAHSDVLEACLDNYKKVTNINFSKIAFVKITEATSKENINIVSPDAGAFKKIYDVAKANDISNIIVANKIRNLTTGEILRTEVPGVNDEPGSKVFVIVDDICDGGRTFTEIAKSIRQIRPIDIFNDKIYLVVTHGIFSAGFTELSKYFTEVFTTNSVKDIDDKIVTQIDVFNENF